MSLKRKTIDDSNHDIIESLLLLKKQCPNEVHNKNNYTAINH